MTNYVKFLVILFTTLVMWYTDKKISSLEFNQNTAF